MIMKCNNNGYIKKSETNNTLKKLTHMHARTLINSIGMHICVASA